MSIRRLSCLLATIVILIFHSCKGNYQRLYLILDNANGLKVGSSVMSRGMVIGKVKDMTLKGSGVVVELRIKDEYKLPKGSAFKLVLDNVLEGKSSIDVTFSSSQDWYTDNDSVVVHNNKHFENERRPVELDSSSKAEMLKVFKQLDTLLNPKRK